MQYKYIGVINNILTIFILLLFQVWSVKAIKIDFYFIFSVVLVFFNLLNQIVLFLYCYVFTINF